VQPSSFALAERLDHDLGDPDDPHTPFGFAESLALDDGEVFPARACRALTDWGIQDYYVPAAHGGRLENYADALALMRMIARRDLTVAVGHGKTYLGAVCVWVGSDTAQAAALGARIKDGAIVSLALTERTHGSDLLASDLIAEPDGENFQLSGEKWLINNATRGELLCVLAATDPAQGPRSLTMFLVDKHQLPTESVRCLPKVRTHGIRGADISGITLTKAPVAAGDMLGGIGTGLEILLKALQLTRTMCSALSLGAGDTALRVATGFALERQLYGKALTELPQIRRTLTECFADLLTAEVVALGAARAIDELPGEASIGGAVAKYLVPSTMDTTIDRLRDLLGARAFLKDLYRGGLFQKIQRDHRIVGLFDGNTLVNLQTLITQGRTLARGYARKESLASDLRRTFALDQPVGPLDPRRLRLAASRGSTVVNALPDAVAQLCVLGQTNPGILRAVALAERILETTGQVHTDLAGTPGRVDAIEPEAFEAAERYALCFAGATAIQLFLHNHHHLRAGTNALLWTDARWLSAVLARLLGRLHGQHEELSADIDPIIEPLLAQTRDVALYSLFPVQLARGPQC
jgi:alkylation response protein AidB-like acyl-CoA dehydrogenase